MLDRAYPCPFCLKGLAAYAPYTAMIATLLRLYKTEERRVLAKVLAPLYIPLLAPIEKPVLLAVPASRRGLANRGFDQMMLITHTLTKLTGYPSLHLFKQKGEGQSKFLSLVEREKRHTITLVPLDTKVARFKEEGHTFVLLDDISTTGTTLGHCKILLTERYAIDPLCLVLALG